MWREVDVCGAELFDDQEQPVHFVKLGDLGFKLEFVKYVAGAGREALDVGDQVASDVGRIAQQLFKREAAGIKQLLLAIGGRDTRERLFQRKAGDAFGFQAFLFIQNRLLVLSQHKVETAQHYQG